MEEWKTVFNFEDYIINKEGIIKNKKTKHTLKTHISKGGYYYYILYKNKKSYSRFVHRLIMETFMPCENMNTL